MKRLQLLKAKLKAAKAESIIRHRTYNAAERAVIKLGKTITELERRIAHEQAKLASVK
jgi:predicted  nucleic acid-binding Zn-ribbon protein